MSRFPHALPEFSDYVVTVVPYLLASGNVTRLAVSTGNQTALTAGLTAWNSIWALYTSDATRTKTVTHEVHLQVHSLETLFTSIYGDIPQSALTTTDRDTLHVHLRDTTLTPVGVATVAPKIAVDSQIHESAILRLTNPDTPDIKAMPEGQEVLLEMRIGPVGLHTLVEILAGAPSAVTTPVSRFLFPIAFADGDVGKCAYIRGCYVNTKGEKGPMSEFLIIQIG